MAILTTGSLIGATIPTVPGNALKLFIAAARHTPQMPGNLASLVFNDPLPPGMGTTWNSPKFGTLIGYSLVEGVDIANAQNLAATNVPITPGEVGLQILLSKKSMAQWSENVATLGGSIMREAMDRKKDVDVGGLFASLTLTAGAAAAVMSMGHLSAAVARLAGGTNTTGTAIAAGVGTNVSAGPFKGVFRPESLHALWVALMGAAAFTGATAKTAPPMAAGAMGENLARQGTRGLFVDEIAGVDVYRNPNLAKDASDDTVGAVFAERAIVFVPFPHDGANGMFQRESDDGRFVLFSLVEDYGFGILDGNLGVAVTLDATPPTS
jgi:hypothetical protein